MKKQTLLSLFLAGAMTGGAASAGTPESSAVIKGVEGQVYVRKDETTEPAQDGLSVAPGNQVMTVEGSKAQVVYADGCSVSLPENSLLAIGGPEQCRAVQAKVYSTAGFQEKAIGMTPAAFISWVANTLGVSTTVAASTVIAGASLIVGGAVYSVTELSDRSGVSGEVISNFINSQYAAAEDAVEAADAVQDMAPEPCRPISQEGTIEKCINKCIEYGWEIIYIGKWVWDSKARKWVWKIIQRKFPICRRFG